MKSIRDLEAKLAVPLPDHIDERWSSLVDWPSVFSLVTGAVSEARALPRAEASRRALGWVRLAVEWRSTLDALPVLSNQTGDIGQESKEALKALRDERLQERPTHRIECRKLAQLVACAAHTVIDPEWFGPEGVASGRPMRREITRYASDPVWHRICGRLFLADPRSFSQVQVPVASFEEKTAKGKMLLLDLAVFPDGTGLKVQQHPLDSLAADAESFMLKPSIELAWAAARSLPSREGAPPDGAPRDSVWRVTSLADGRDLQTVELNDRIDGPSTGGAATRGWYYALHGMVPDAEVVVIAEIDERGDTFRLGGVERGPEVGDDSWIREKVRCVIEAKRFDTLVVVEDERHNAASAKEMLDEANSAIRLVVLTPDQPGP